MLTFRRSFVIAGLALTLLGRAPDLSAQASAPVLVSFSVPASITAGGSLAMEAIAESIPDSMNTGQVRAWVDISGPSGQSVKQFLYLAPGSTTRFAYAMAIPTHFEPGVWRIERLSMEAFTGNIPEVTVINRGDTAAGGIFAPQFTVTNASGGDTAAAVVQEIQLSPDPVEAGARLTFQVRLQAPASGIREAKLQVTYMSQMWPPIYLTYRQATGLWQGAHLVPLVGPGQSLGITVNHVDVLTGGAVASRTLCASLSASAAKCTATVVPGNATIAALNVAPTMSDLHHPGGLPFKAWHDLDKAYVLGLFDRLDKDPNGLREILYGQLPAIGPAIDDILKQTYTDQGLGFPISPANATGKYNAMGGAARGRWLMMGELDRRALGLPLPLLRDTFDTHWKFEDPDRAPLVSQQIIADVGALYAQRIIETARDSQIPTPVWKQPHGEDFFSLMVLTRKPMVWVHPTTGVHQAGGTSAAKVIMYMPGTLPSLMPTAHNIVHEFGHTFHMVYIDRPQFLNVVGGGTGPIWQDYLTLRGNQPWISIFDIWWGARPLENFAEDFARTYNHPDFGGTPLDSVIRYPQFQDDPASETKFKALVQREVAIGPQTPLTIDWDADRVLATLPGPFTLKGTWVPGGNVHVAMSSMETVWMNNTRVGMGKIMNADNAGRWSATFPDGLSPLQTFRIGAMTPDRTISQVMQVVVFRYPLLLDGTAVQTTADSIKLTGRTVPGWSVSAAGQIVTVDGGGHFETTQPLAPGLNQLRLVATAPSGNEPPAGVIVEIVRGTAAEAAALTDRPVVASARALLPDATELPLSVMVAWREFNDMALNGNTMAGATVTWGDVTVTADADGYFSLRRPNAQVTSPAVVTGQLGARVGRWEGPIFDVVPMADAGVPPQPDAGQQMSTDAAASDAAVSFDAGRPDAFANTGGTGGMPMPRADGGAVVIADGGADAMTLDEGESGGGCGCVVGGRERPLGGGTLFWLLAAAGVTLRITRRRRR